MKPEEYVYIIVYKNRDEILVVGKSEIMRLETRENLFEVFKVFCKNFDGMIRVPYNFLIWLLLCMDEYLKQKGEGREKK